MAGRFVVEDFVVPARYGSACRVERRQFLRIYQVEGQQVGDCAFFNADNPREQFHVGQTWALNVMLGHGTARSFRYFYSKPPYENVVLSVVDDTVRAHLPVWRARALQHQASRAARRGGKRTQLSGESSASARPI